MKTNNQIHFSEGMQDDFQFHFVCGEQLGNFDKFEFEYEKVTCDKCKEAFNYGKIFIFNQWFHHNEEVVVDGLYAATIVLARCNRKIQWCLEDYWCRKVPIEGIGYTIQKRSTYYQEQYDKQMKNCRWWQFRKKRDLKEWLKKKLLRNNRNI